MGPARTDTVSVILPTYYRNEKLAEALESVERQTYHDIECIVVDDSGERFAKPVADEHEVEYVPHDENCGAPAARETGLSVATGSYVQFLDDDDSLRPRKIEAQVERLQQPDVGVVYCGVEMSDGTVALPTDEQLDDVRYHALTFSLWPCVTSSMLIERDHLVQIDDFARYPGAQDSAMMIELAHVTRFDAVFEPLVYKHRSPGSLEVSADAVASRFQIIEDKRAFYEAAGDDVRRRALARAHENEASCLLRSHIWSTRAPAAYLRAATTNPGTSLNYLLLFGASLLGRPGVTLAETVYDRYVRRE